ncbi:MAG: tagaturonate reductase [[Eubacterium] siraeum]|nr:tagaturonate reductase [[Eubacterium] siraeum]
MAVVLYISLPLILLGAFSYLSSIIDTVVVAKNDNDALSSVVMISQIKNLFTALGSGFATGGSIIVARLIGRNEYDRARQVANTLLTIFFCAAVIIVSVFTPFAMQILRLFGLTQAMAESGVGYFRIQIVSIGVSMFNTVFLGLEKARGATVNILFVNIMSMSLKLAFTVVFVSILQLGTEMVAASTLLADISVSCYALTMLIRKKYLFHYSVKNTSFTKEYILPLCSLSIPVFLGKFVFSMGKVIVNSLAIGYGEDAPGALGVSNQISGSVTNITNCTEDSESSVQSYNLSAGNYSRMIRIFFCTLAINLAISAVGVTVLTVFREQISMFFADGNPGKAELIGKIFYYERIGIVALGINAAVNGLVYGIGYTKLSMVCNLSRLFVFRIPSMLIMINCFPEMGAESLGIAMLISNVGIGLMSVVIGIVCLFKVKNHTARDRVMNNNPKNNQNERKPFSMKDLNRSSHETVKRPIKIMQFGEGNFLRAFVDWILQDLNDKQVINSNVVVVQPMPMGRVKELAAQDGLYTLCLEGIDKGEKVQSRNIIDVLGDFVNPFEEYDRFLSYGKSEELEIVISNTTEAGIALDSTDTDLTKCPKSFPGKLLALLKARYDRFNGDMSKGLAIIPCELIDHNGDELKRVLTELAEINKMDKEFINWLTTANHFTSTLVDRIVPGYPRDTAKEICEETGFNDNNIVKGEIFHLWVLQKEAFVQSKLPADKSGLNVIFADDITPYKQRKVKILNGSHTSMVPVAYLCGIDTVREAVTDEDAGKFVQGLVKEEIKPTIELPKDEMDAFASSVIERFMNPFIRHELMSIALNSTTKFKTRLLPTYNDYRKKFGRSPKHVLFSLASLIVFYRGKRGSEDIALNDSPEYLSFWKEAWQLDDCTEIAKKVLSAADIWEQDLSADDDNVKVVAGYIENIVKNGEREALRAFLAE